MRAAAVGSRRGADAGSVRFAYPPGAGPARPDTLQDGLGIGGWRGPFAEEGWGCQGAAGRCSGANGRPARPRRGCGCAFGQLETPQAAGPPLGLRPLLLDGASREWGAGRNDLPEALPEALAEALAAAWPRGGRSSTWHLVALLLRPL